MGKESPFLIDNEAHWFNQWRRLKNKRLGYIMYCEVRKLPFLKGNKLLPCVIAWLADLFLRHYSLWLKTNNVPENEYFLIRWGSLIRCETTKVWNDRLITNSFYFGGEFYTTLQYFKVTGQILTGKTGLIHSRLCH